MRPIRPIALVTYFVLLLLLFNYIPIWLTFVAALGSLWKSLSMRTGLYQAPRTLLFIMGLLFFLMAAAESPRFWHRETATSLVVILALITLLDRPHRRQIMLLHGYLYAMLLGFLVAPGPIYPLFVYFSLTALIFLGLMLHHLPRQPVFSLLPLGRNLFKIALPVAAILLPVYFYFPEIRTDPSQTGITGISNILEPGRIASLAVSDRVAFRARIVSAPERLPPLYWRVAVLNESFGMVWRKKEDTPEVSVPDLRRTALMEYHIVTDARLRGLLPMLEHTVFARPMQQAESAVTRQPTLNTFRSYHTFIEAGSDLSAAYYPDSPPEFKEPYIHTSSRVRDLVARLESLPVEEQVKSLLRFFAEFRYTLNPGTLDSEDKLDEFLFEKRVGFCEHFAAAFASLLQLAGTPARIVTGFQGGTLLGTSGFILVLDSDAHAWTEVWYGDRWQRIDPTSAVPGSQRQGQESSLGQLIGAWLSYGSQILGAELSRLLQDFELIWLVLLGIAGVLLIPQALRIYRRQHAQAPWAPELRHLLTELKDEGYTYQTIEPLGSFFRRIGAERPQLQESFERLAAGYNSHVYGPPQDAPTAEQLQSLLRTARLRWEQQRTRRSKSRLVRRSSKR